MSENRNLARIRSSSLNGKRRRNSLPDLNRGNDPDQGADLRNTSRDDSSIGLRRVPRADRRVPVPPLGGDRERDDPGDDEAADIASDQRLRPRSASSANPQEAPNRAENVGRPRALSQELRRGDDRVPDSAQEFEAIREKEPDDGVVKALIGLEKNLDVRAIRELYDAGATSDDIRFLLQKEPDAQTLNNQIQDEASSSVAKIRRLYTVDGINSKDVTAMLALEKDGDKLHRLTTRQNERFQADNLQFVSMTDGKAGSIYFGNHSRIRLVHASGPDPDTKYDRSDRFSIQRDEYDRFQQWKVANPGATKQEQYDEFTTNYPSAQLETRDTVPDQPTGERKLMEFLYRGDDIVNTHPSRGEPVKLNHNMSQYHINILYNLSEEASATLKVPNREFKQARKDYYATANLLAQWTYVRDNYPNIIAQLQTDITNRQLAVQAAQAAMQQASLARDNQDNRVSTALQLHLQDRSHLINKRNYEQALNRYATLSQRYLNEKANYDRLNSELTRMNNQLGALNNNLEASEGNITILETSAAEKERTMNERQAARDLLAAPFNEKLYTWIKALDATKAIPVRRNPDE